MAVAVDAELTFLEALRANLVMVRWMPKLGACYLFLFLFGIALFIWNMKSGEPVAFSSVFPCALVSISPVFFVLIIAWKMRAYWRKHGGTVFKFANNGIQAATGLYNATIAWAAIERVRFSKEFVFLFTSARAVFIVPRRAFSGSDEQDFLAMAASCRA